MNKNSDLDLYQNALDDNDISILDIIRIISKHYKIIIGISGCMSIVAIIFVLYFLKPEYTSTSSFISSGQGNSQPILGITASQLGIALPGLNSSSEWSYEEVIKSRKMANLLLDSKFNTQEFGKNKSLFQILTYGNEPINKGLDTLRVEAINSIFGMVSIKKSTNLYNLQITASEPQLAADISRVLLYELDRHQREFNSKKMRETRQFIEDRLVESKDELEDFEELLRDFRISNRSISMSPQLQLEQERLVRDVAVATGVFTSMKEQLEVAKIAEIKESDYVIILDEPDTPLYPSKPKKKLIVTLVGVLGLGLSIVVAFVYEQFNNKNKSN